MSMLQVWLVLPAYNEAENLPGLFRDFVALREENQDLALHLIVIDDGSTDDTYEVARAAPAALQPLVLQNARNLGLGETFKKGMHAAIERAAPSDIIVTMDADHTHLPGLILRMVRTLREGRDVVIASRFQPGSITRGVPAHRQLLSRGMSAMFRGLLPVDGVRDFSCGYRAYRAGLLQTAQQRFGDTLFAQKGFVCMVDTLVKLDELGAVFGEVPLVLRYDNKRGPSKLPIGSTVADTLALLGRARLRRFLRSTRS
jgi:dolichol-phosphate mannosyltransferase